jgi:hypothetical protein
VDEGSLIEYGPLVIAAQRTRRTVDDLRRNTPGDGMVAGLASVNAALFGAEQSRVMAMSYDYTVLAGTQGWLNHKKKDRLFEIAQRLRLPVVLFAEGGGGRPGDVDMPIIAGLDCLAFQYFAKLLGPGADDRHPVGALLCGQCGADRLLRRHHRDPPLVAGHGRTGDDRGRRPAASSPPTTSDRRR